MALPLDRGSTSTWALVSLNKYSTWTAAKSIHACDVIDVTAQVKGQRIILIISGTTYTPEDSNPRHDNAVYLHEILPRKRSKKVSEIFSGPLRARTQCIGHSCVFRELPGPLGGLTDGGLAKTLDNHHSTQRKKRKKKNNNKWCNRKWRGRMKCVYWRWSEAAGQVKDPP